MSGEGRQYIVWLEDCDASAVGEVGGKGAGLGELVGAGIAVPSGFVVTTAAHRLFLAANGLAEREAELVASMDVEQVGSVTRVSEEIRRLTEAAAIPDPIDQAIVESYEALCTRCGADDLPVAARSSASAEDLATASFAGQLRTYLWVVGPEELLGHVRRCWAGFFSPEALTYRHRIGLDEDEPLMAVCVQQMVDARTAGVMFTLNPLNGDRSKIAIEASWGLGEALVSGEVNPDRFLVDKVTLDILDRSIGDKELEHRFEPERRKVVRAEVDPERRASASITDDEVVELARQGKQIERHYGRPVDVEWAIDRLTGRLYALQSRPETVWSQREAVPVAEKKASPTDYVLAGLIGPGAASGKAEKESG